jgi:hypothetical protein
MRLDVAATDPAREEAVISTHTLFEVLTLKNGQ